MGRHYLKAGLLSAMGGGFIAAAALFAAPPAQASCGEGKWMDPMTRVCWDIINSNDSYGGPNSPCLPGRIGSCLPYDPGLGPGALQDTFWPQSNR